MNHNYFNITTNSFPNSVYNAVGQIIMNSQKWEEDFKNLAKQLNINVKKVEKLSLNKLNDALNKNGIVNDNYFEKLKNIINIRNHINHRFFLEEFNDSTKPYDEKINYINDSLNSAQFLIYEANDIISNLLDELNGINCKRPTVFD